MDAKTANSSTSMRVQWFDHVRKSRKRLIRDRKGPVTHQEAMRQASTTWATKKEKIQKRIQREKKRLEKQKA